MLLGAMDWKKARDQANVVERKDRQNISERGTEEEGEKRKEEEGGKGHKCFLERWRRKGGG